MNESTHCFLCQNKLILLTLCLMYLNCFVNFKKSFHSLRNMLVPTYTYKICLYLYIHIHICTYIFIYIWNLWVPISLASFNVVYIWNLWVPISLASLNVYIHMKSVGTYFIGQLQCLYTYDTCGYLFHWPAWRSAQHPPPPHHGQVSCSPSPCWRFAYSLSCHPWLWWSYYWVR